MSHFLLFRRSKTSKKWDMVRDPRHGGNVLRLCRCGGGCGCSLIRCGRLHCVRVVCGGLLGGGALIWGGLLRLRCGFLGGKGQLLLRRSGYGRRRLYGGVVLGAFLALVAVLAHHLLLRAKTYSACTAFLCVTYDGVGIALCD